MIVDSHQHFWRLGRFDYPWMTPDLGVLYRDYLPETLEPILNRSGVSKTVLVQASNSLEETKWLLALSDKYEFIGGVVGWVDLTSSSVTTQIDEFTRYPKFKGVRHLIESEPADDWLVRGDVLSGLKALEDRDVSYDLLVHTRHLKHVPTVAQMFPNLRLVIDHLAKPPIAKTEIEEWKAVFQSLAQFQNISCKLSGMVTEANHASWKTDDLRPYVATALESFGVERLMFGSDWPVCLLAASYERVLESAQGLVSDLEMDSQTQIFAANAVDFYKL